MQFEEVGHFCPTVLRSTWTQLAELGEDIRRLFLQKNFVSEFGDLATFSNADDSKLSDVENDAKFRTI